MTKIKKASFVFLTLPLIQFCVPSTSQNLPDVDCPYSFAFVNFSGNEIELYTGDSEIFSGYISLGDESTGLNFIKEVSLQEGDRLIATIDGTRNTIETGNSCEFDVVYIQPYEPFLRMTDDKIPIVF